jgi:L-threonylcarbamoyladenylate synthase
VPAHPVAQALLRAFGRPIAAPSANPSGRASPTRAAHVLDGLGGRIAAVIDGGPCAVGLESTIMLADLDPILLRPGGVTQEAIESVLNQPVSRSGGDPRAPTAPGQLASHYAPVASVRLNATSAAKGEVMVGFGPVSGALSLSPAGDLAEAATRLFHTLREADKMAGPNGRIAFAPIPETGLGRAINDRLRRAAAPRL